MKVKIYFDNTNLIVPVDAGGSLILDHTPEYARLAIQRAFREGNHTEMPPSPVLPIEPDWLGFNMAIFSNAEWQSWAIPHDLRVAIISATIGRLPDQLQSAYDSAKSLIPPSPQTLTQWATIADQFNIPMEF